MIKSINSLTLKRAFGFHYFSRTFLNTLPKNIILTSHSQTFNSHTYTEENEFKHSVG